MSGILNALVGSYAPVSGSFESIATATGTGSSGTITFSSIPSTYQHLQIRYICKHTSTASTAVDDLRIEFNSGGNFAWHILQGNGSAATATAGSGASYIQLNQSIPTNSASLSNSMGVGIIDIHDYASTTKNKTTRTFYGMDANISNTIYRTSLSSGLWINTNAITSIVITSPSAAFTTSSTFALYGIKGA